jgi:transposase
MVGSTKYDDIANILGRIDIQERQMVREVTVDFSASMERAVRLSFPNARVTNDRFHAQQLVSESLQEMRIKERWQAIAEETQAREIAKRNKLSYTPVCYENGDSKKQLLARSRHLLFKPSSSWTLDQRARAEILFRELPSLHQGYKLSMMFRNCYEQAKTRGVAQGRFRSWYAKVDEQDDALVSIKTAKEYIRSREETILNYFPHRNTNASAESFNAKLKGFRALVRGVRDTKFFLFRVYKLYA